MGVKNDWNGILRLSGEICHSAALYFIIDEDFMTRLLGA